MNLKLRESLPRRGLWLGVAAAVVAVSMATAAAATDDGAHGDEDNAREVDRSLSAQGRAVHGPGWRQELDAERVICATVEGDSYNVVTDTQASSFAMSNKLTMNALAAECASGIDATRGSSRSTTDVSVCMRDATTPRPVVLLGGEPCGSAGLRSAASGDLAQLNRLRSVEIELLAVPSSDDCPSSEGATSWATERLRARRVELAVDVLDEGVGCYRPVAYWDEGRVLVQPLGQQP